MITIDYDKCTGCGACRAVCSVNAVSLKMRGGYNYPDIDKNKCIECRKCEKVCPITNTSEKAEKPIIKIGNSLNEYVRNQSSSGGVFYELAYYIIKELHGTVYGAAYDSDFSVKHIRASDIDNLSRLCTSKYVQSNIGDCFLDAISDLKNGKTVLFSGTPCQTEGMKKVCPDNMRENLYLCSVACHGVSSPVLWENYRKSLEHKYNSKIKKVNMRDKRKGWHRYSMSVNFESGKKYSKIHDVDPYFNLFLSGNYLRPSCYNCCAKGLLKDTDFLIADAWGYESHTAGKVDDKGKSVICMMTSKAVDLLQPVNIVTEEYSEDIIRHTHRSIFEPAQKDCSERQKLKDMNGEEALRFFNKNGKLNAKKLSVYYLKLFAEKVGVISLLRKYKL